MRAGVLGEFGEQVLARLPFALAVTDPDGTITFWNDRAVELYGWTSEEAIGCSFRALLEGGATQPVNVRDVPLVDDEGKVTGVIVVSEPIDADDAAPRLESLASVTMSLAAARTSDDVGDALLDRGAGLVGAEGAALCRLTPPRTLEVMAARGIPASALRLLESAPIDELAIPIAVALRTREPVLLEHDDAGGAVAALPLLIGDDVIGGLVFRFGAARAFTAADRRALVGMAGAAALALHAVIVGAKEDDRAQVVTSFMDTAPVGLALVDEDLRFRVVNRCLARLTGEPVADHRGRPVEELFGDAEPEVAPIARSVLDSGTPVIGVEARCATAPGRVLVLSCYPVPGPGRSRRVGLVVDDVTARRRDEERLRDESQIVETLHFVGRQLAGELDAVRVLDVITQAAAQVTDADVGVYLAPGDGDVPVMLASTGDVAPFFARFDRQLTDRALRDGEVIRVDDAGGRCGATSFLGAPVRSREGRILGALFLADHRMGVFDGRDERLVIGIVGQVAIALDNARLYERERNAREHVALLAEAGRVLASTMEVEDLLRRVARLVVPALADHCAIDLVGDDDGDARRVVVVGRDDELIRGLREHAPTPDDLSRPMLRRIRTATSVQYVTPDEALLAELAPDDRHYRQRVLDTVGSAAIVPMPGRDAMIGRLTLLRSVDAVPFGDDDTALLADLGRRIAVAVENARLFARQRSVAVSLQQSLLPDRLPDVPGVSLAARYLPGGPDVEVGGDWYDLLPMPDGTMGFAMGDVVGRGARAAALMGQLRSALRGYALEGHRPGSCLALLDRLLGVITGGALVTAVKGHLYPSERRLLLSNAGHVPPLLVHPDGRTEFVGAALGPPLSTLDDPSYDDIALDLEPGTTIILYTDGLVEERDESIEVGLDRLVTAVQSAPTDDLEALADHILSSLLGDRTKRDDVALLVVRLDRDA